MKACFYMMRNAYRAGIGLYMIAELWAVRVNTSHFNFKPNDRNALRCGHFSHENNKKTIFRNIQKLLTKRQTSCIIYLQFSEHANKRIANCWFFEKAIRYKYILNLVYRKS